MAKDALQFTQITDRVWILPRHPDKNRVQATVGMVMDGRQTILIDAGNSPHLARHIVATLAALKAPPISQIIYTHHHWDHTFGAHVYGVPAVAHEKCRELLRQMQAENIGEQLLRTKIERNPNLILAYTAADWEAFEIIVPETTFDESYQLQMDGITLQLEYVGGRHAIDSSVIKVVEEGVMFLGDCYYPPPAYEGRPETMISFSMLSDLVDETYHTYIDGHNAPFKRKHIQRILQSHALLTRLNQESKNSTTKVKS